MYICSAIFVKAGCFVTASQERKYVRDDGTRYCWAGYGEDKQFDIEVSFDEENDIIKTEIDIVGWYLVTEKIRNVHQLQNIFWNFNIDIEIEHV